MGKRGKQLGYRHETCKYGHSNKLIVTRPNGFRECNRCRAVRNEYGKYKTALKKLKQEDMIVSWATYAHASGFRAVIYKRNGDWLAEAKAVADRLEMA